MIRAGVGAVRTLATRALAASSLVTLATRILATSGLVTLSRGVRTHLRTRIPLLSGAALAAVQHVEEFGHCAHIGAAAALRADRLPRPVIHALIVPFAGRRR